MEIKYGRAIQILYGTPACVEHIMIKYTYTEQIASYIERYVCYLNVL